MQFLARGYHACVLRYSVAPARYPVPLLELGQVMRILRSHAAEWLIDTDKIFVSGASAGLIWPECLACSGIRDGWRHAGDYRRRVKAGGLLLSYPVITSREGKGHLPSFRNLLGEEFKAKRGELSLETQVTADTPPVFLWHTAVDQTVPAVNSLLMAQALMEKKVPVELHIYPEGVHGLSLGTEQVRRADGTGVNEASRSWMELACDWIRRLCEEK